MNIKSILENLVGFFNREKIYFALIGALTLKAYGYMRPTQDFRFLARSRDQEKLVRFLKLSGTKPCISPEDFQITFIRLPVWAE